MKQIAFTNLSNENENKDKSNLSSLLVSKTIKTNTDEIKEGKKKLASTSGDISREEKKSASSAATVYEKFLRKIPKQLCPLDPSFKLMPHQVDDVQIMLKRKDLVYANQLGLGKTTSSAFFAKVMVEDWIRDQAAKGTSTTRSMTAEKFYQVFKNRGLIPPSPAAAAKKHGKSERTIVADGKNKTATAGKEKKKVAVSANSLKRAETYSHNNESMSKSNLITLIICDASVVSRWLEDFKKISPEFAAKHVWFCDSSLSNPSTTKRGPKFSHLICLVTYGLLEYSNRNTNKIGELPAWVYEREWKNIFMDEAHKIYPKRLYKKGQSKVNMSIKSVYNSIIKLKCENFLLVTGTPIQTKIDDLFFFDYIFSRSYMLDDVKKRDEERNRMVDLWKDVEESSQVFLDWNKKHIMCKTRAQAYEMALTVQDTYATELLRPRGVKVVMADLGEMCHEQKKAIIDYSDHFNDDNAGNNHNFCMLIGIIGRISVSHYLVPENPADIRHFEEESKLKSRRRETSRRQTLKFAAQGTVMKGAAMIAPTSVPLNSKSFLSLFLSNGDGKNDDDDDKNDQDYLPSDVSDIEDDDENSDSDEEKEEEEKDTAIYPWQLPGVTPTMLRDKSPMIQYISKVVQRAVLEKKKVVIFNSEVKQLLLFKYVLRATNILKKDPLIFVGCLKNIALRKEILDNFQKSSAQEEPVIFVSTRAGCCGIDLSAGTIAIMTNHSFNPIVEVQAMERISRIGQLKDIELHYPRFTCPWALDEWISAVHRRKLKFAGLVAHHLVDRPTGFELEILTCSSTSAATGDGKKDFLDKNGLINNREYKMWKNRLDVAIKLFINDEYARKDKQLKQLNLLTITDEKGEEKKEEKTGEKRENNENKGEEKISFRKRKFDLLYTSSKEPSKEPAVP